MIAFMHGAPGLKGGSFAVKLKACSPTARMYAPGFKKQTGVDTKYYCMIFRRRDRKGNYDFDGLSSTLSDPFSGKVKKVL